MQVCAAIIAGVGAMLAAPWTPLRVSAACAVPLFAGLFFAPRFRTEFRVLWLFYGWFSLSAIAIVSIHYSNGAGGIPLALVAIGQALAVAATLRMPKLKSEPSSILGPGVAGGCLIMAIFLAILQLTGYTGDAAMGPTPITLLFILAVGAFIAARSAKADMAPRPMNSAMCVGLSLPVLISIFMFGVWWTARTNVEYHLQNGDATAAARWNDREISSANLLGVGKWRATAFLHGAAIYEQNPFFYPVYLRHALTVDPLNIPANQRMLETALRGNDYDRAMQCFTRLPDGSVSPYTAHALLAPLATRTDWPSFFRAWRRASPLIPAWSNLTDTAATDPRARYRLPSDIDWNRVMVAVYHHGEFGIVAEIAALCEVASTNAWPMRRTHVMSLHHSKSPRIAEEKLVESCEGRIPAESSYMAALIDQELRPAATNAAKSLMEKTLRLNPSHYGARRWLARQGGELTSDPLVLAPGVTFPGKLRLVDCEATPLRVAPGAAITVTSWWEILGPVDPSWKVFLHMRRNIRDGNYFQGDYLFSEVVGDRPWMIGELFKHERTVPVPPTAPAGEYRVVIGLWDRVTVFTPVAEDKRWNRLRPIANRRILLDAIIEIAPGR